MSPDTPSAKDLAQHPLYGIAGPFNACMFKECCVALAAERDALRVALDAAQAPREVPRLTDEQMLAVFEGAVADYVDITDDEVCAFGVAVESRVRELCGVAP